MNSEDVVIFHGQELKLVEQNGEVFVVMKPVVTGMGLDWKNQYEKLITQQDKFNYGVITTVASDGKNRDMVCIPLKKLNGWLFSVNANKVREDLHDKIVLYQEECSQVLYEYWFKKSSTQTLPNPSLFEMSILASKAVADMLKISEAGKIKMLSTICKIYNVPSSFLPDYTDEKHTRSLTYLLKKHDEELSTRAVNIILMKMGIVEQKTRPSSKGKIKKFKALTDKGLFYGKNLINPQNEKETQPHYFEDTFEKLLSNIHK